MTSTELEWLVALFEPRAISYHPNHPADVRSSPPQQMAALAIGESSGWGSWVFRQYERHGVALDPGVAAARAALTEGTVRQGVDALRQISNDHTRERIGVRAVLAVVAAAAASEIEEHEVVLDMLTRHRSDLSAADDVGSRLMYAFVTQQLAMRAMEIGREYEALAVDALTTLETLNTDAFPQLPLSAATGATTATVFSKIIAFLIDASYSVLGPDFEIDGKEGNHEQVWVVQQRRGVPELRSRTEAMQSEAFQKAEEARYRAAMANRRRAVSSDADFFFEVLPFEWAGHAYSHSLRKSLGIRRLNEAVELGREDNISDALRLLRHSGDRQALDAACQWVRFNGPLDALGKATRLAIRRTAGIAAVRAVDLSLLSAGADLLTESESEGIIRTAMNDDGTPYVPPDWPHHAQAVALKLGASLAALGSAAAGARARSIVSHVLLSVAKSAAGDQLLDREVARALDRLSDGGAPKALEDLDSSGWTEWSERLEANEMRATRTAASRAFGYPQASWRSVEPTLADIAERVDEVMLGLSFEYETLHDDINRLIDAMAREREDAHSGRYFFGGARVADVAAAVVATVDGADRLWQPLSGFLCDSAIPRSERDWAFDRIAYSARTPPEEVLENVRSVAHDALTAAPVNFFDDSGVSALLPYPHALRFFVRIGAIDEWDGQIYLAQLSGQLDNDGRAEAAKCADLFSTRMGASWLLPIAFELSYDSSAIVRGRAGSALMNLANASDDQMHSRVAARVVEMLSDDGVAVPIFLLRSGRPPDTPSGDSLLEEMAGRVADLADHHPSRAVRAAASRWISPSPGGSPEA